MRQHALTLRVGVYNVAPRAVRTVESGVAADSKPPEFEQALDELEKLVERLERGDLPLDEALKIFERGVELTRHCQGALKAAQQRVEILVRRSGQNSVEPFAVEDTSSDAPVAGTQRDATPER
jgi:exodeoxyribonuclease VII small subunit